MRSINYDINSEWNGKTVLVFLKNHVGLSSRTIKILKRAPKGIMLNNKHVRTVDFVSVGDTLTVNIPTQEVRALPVEMPIEVMYHDEDVMVINKPYGMPVHESRNHRNDTLSNAVAHYMNKLGKSYSFHAVNRLDKDTSGLVLVGLNRFSAASLAKNVEKTYFAVVSGVYMGEGSIDAPIGRAGESIILREVSPDGERAVTRWKALKTDGVNTLLEIQLQTGRTHQIRVHFSYLGTPLLGDEMYGGTHELISRQALHCGKMSFIHPISKKGIDVVSPFFEDMMDLTNKMR